jgi:hypothetical protein
MARWTLALALPLIVLPGLAGCSSTQGESYLKPGYDLTKLQRIAVVDGNNTYFDAPTRQTLVDTFQMEFIKRGWNVIERSNIDKAMDEMDFQNKEITSEVDRKQLGAVLNVQALTIVNVGATGDELSLTVKMVDVETGEVVWMANGGGSVNSGLSTFAGALTGVAIGAVAGKNMGDNAGVGAVAGGLAGGGIGAAMAPSEMENAKKVVKKVCEDIPVRG